MDRLRALSIFKAIVDAGSFVGASTALDLSTAVVSRTVQELEDQLGARLLNRSTRRVTLTAVGEVVLSRVEGLLESYEELNQIAQSSSGEASGVVRLAAPAEIGCHHLVPQLAAFRAACPAVKVDLQLSDGAANDAGDEPDLVLCLASQLRPTQIARPLAQIAMGLFAARAYLLRSGNPVHPSELAAHDCLTCGTSRGRQSWSFSGPGEGEACMVEVKGTLNSNHIEVITEAAVHGAGIVMLPLVVAQPLVERGALQRILAGWPAESQMLHVTYRSRKNLPMAVRRLIEHLVASFGDEASESAPTKDEPRLRPVLPGLLHKAANLDSRMVA